MKKTPLYVINLICIAAIALPLIDAFLINLGNIDTLFGILLGLFAGLFYENYIHNYENPNPILTKEEFSLKS